MIQLNIYIYEDGIYGFDFFPEMSKHFTKAHIT